MRVALISNCDVRISRKGTQVDKLPMAHWRESRARLRMRWQLGVLYDVRAPSPFSQSAARRPRKGADRGCNAIDRVVKLSKSKCCTVRRELSVVRCKHLYIPCSWPGKLTQGRGGVQRGLAVRPTGSGRCQFRGLCRGRRGFRGVWYGVRLPWPWRAVQQ
jgi:hypothetical protein